MRPVRRMATVGMVPVWSITVYGTCEGETGRASFLLCQRRRMRPIARMARDRVDTDNEIANSLPHTFSTVRYLVIVLICIKITQIEITGNFTFQPALVLAIFSIWEGSSNN